MMLDFSVRDRFGDSLARDFDLNFMGQRLVSVHQDSPRPLFGIVIKFCVVSN